jgi:hypothetical protein
MYSKLVKNQYSSRSEELKIVIDKIVWPDVQKLERVIKLILFKKIDMFIIAYELSGKVQFPGLRSDLKISPIVSHEQIASLNKVVGLSNYKPYKTMNWLHRVFNSGSIGFIAIQNDIPVGCCWASEKMPSSLFPGVRLPLEQGDICVHTLFVSQLNRRQRIGEALASYRLCFLQKQHYKRAIATVDKDNLAALKVDRKIGYGTIGEISGFRILYWSRLTYKWH